MSGKTSKNDGYLSNIMADAFSYIKSKRSPSIFSDSDDSGRQDEDDRDARYIGYFEMDKEQKKEFKALLTRLLKNRATNQKSSWENIDSRARILELQNQGLVTKLEFEDSLNESMVILG